MRTRILLNCKDYMLLQEAFVDTDKYHCISTSGFIRDILGHASCFKPDVYVTVLYEWDYNLSQQFYRLKKKPEFAGVSFAMLGSEEICRLALAEEGLFEYCQPIEDDNISGALTKIAELVAQQNGSLDYHEYKAHVAEKKHILIVDDDKTTLRLLKTALEEKRYNVTAVADGALAEKYLQTKTADLILLDYLMPKESGADVLRMIRSEKRLSDIPVIFLTGVSDAELVQDVISMKPQGYLLKPINMERLMIMIRNLMG